MSRTYLDWNATAPLLPEVAALMTSVLLLPGNASSLHSEGRVARRWLEDARASVAALVGAEARNVFFTASGTEAANAVLSPGLGQSARQRGCTELLVSTVEHPSILAGARFPTDKVTLVPVHACGLLDMAELNRIVQAKTEAGERVLLSLQAANNETGILQPIAGAAELVHAAGGLVHVDAVQAAGRISCDIKTVCADVITLSGHKFGGPKGAASIVFASEELRLAEPLIRGGGQERGQRAGTENVAAIAGLGLAAELALRNLDQFKAVARMREDLEAGILLRAADAVIFGRALARLPNTSCFAVPGLRAETALIGFDLDGVAVSSGSACSSGKVGRSHVLTAMGVDPHLIEGAIRVSLGPTTMPADLGRFFSALENRLSSLCKTRMRAA